MSFCPNSLVALADRVFDSPELAVEWLTTPNQALGNRTPLEACRTAEGAREIQVQVRLALAASAAPEPCQPTGESAAAEGPALPAGPQLRRIEHLQGLPGGRNRGEGGPHQITLRQHIGRPKHRTAL